MLSGSAALMFLYSATRCSGAALVNHHNTRLVEAQQVCRPLSEPLVVAPAVLNRLAGHGVGSGLGNITGRTTGQHAGPPVQVDLFVEIDTAPRLRAHRHTPGRRYPITARKPGEKTSLHLSKTRPFTYST